MGIGAMSDEAYEELNEALAARQEWAISQWIKRGAPMLQAEERVVAAVELAASWWLPVLEARDAQNAQEVRQLLRTAAEFARNPALPQEVLKHARDTRVGLPPSGPPPPYVGHFCATVMHLLDTMLDPPNYDDLAEALSFATVAPDGSSHRKEIADVMRQ